MAYPSGNEPVWDTRNRAVLDLFEQAVAPLRAGGAEASEANGWIHRASMGRITADASLSRPWYDIIAPDTVILIQRAWDHSLPIGKPARRELRIVFEAGSCTMTGGGLAVARDAAAWMAERLVSGLPPRQEPAARTGKSASRKRKPAAGRQAAMAASDTLPKARRRLAGRAATGDV